MKPLGVVIRGITTLWFRGAQPSRIDAEYLTFLWQKGRRELRRGSDGFEEPFESYVAGMRKLGLEGGLPGRADWAIVLQDPPAKLMAAFVAAALRMHPAAAVAARSRPSFADAEIYPELFRS
jgi:hypothetical protein